MKGQSLRKLINMKCKDCGYDSLDTGTWKAQIEACPVTLCPLHPVRPITTGSTKKRAIQRKKEG